MDFNSVSQTLQSYFKPPPFTSLTAHMKKDSASGSQLSLMWPKPAPACRSLGSGQIHGDGNCYHSSAATPCAATSQPRKFPGPLQYFFTAIAGCYSFYYTFACYFCCWHKQCGQFCFTCPGVSDSSPASVALSGYTVKCLANKMHKAEIGKSMPLLQHFTIFHAARQAGLPAEAGARGTTWGVCHQATCQLAPEAVLFALPFSEQEPVREPWRMLFWCLSWRQSVGRKR